RESRKMVGLSLHPLVWLRPAHFIAAESIDETSPGYSTFLVSDSPLIVLLIVRCFGKSQQFAGTNRLYESEQTILPQTGRCGSGCAQLTLRDARRRGCRSNKHPNGTDRGTPAPLARV